MVLSTAAKIERMASDDKKGWIVLNIETPKYPGGQAIQACVAKTGKVRVYGPDGEWLPPQPSQAKRETLMIPRPG